MLIENAEMGVSFELPDRLTVDQLDCYQGKIAEYLSDYKNTFLSNVRYRAMIYSAAVVANLISNWQSETMPEVRPSDVGGADAQVINFVGIEVEAYIKTYTDIPPK